VLCLNILELNLRRFKLKVDKKQSCPNLSDLENEEVKKLARRLEGNSEKETLANILEWQDRNLQYWKERGILEAQWFFLAILIIVLYTIVSLPILLLLYYYLVTSKVLPTNISQVLVLTAFTVFLMFFLLQNALIKIIYVLMLFYPTFLLEKLYLLSLIKNPASLNVVLALISLNGIFFGAAILSFAYLMMSYNPTFRGEPLRTRILKILRIMNDTFQFSLPVDKVLKYRMAICRDYAKLTAALLFNQYSDSKVYFITIPRHVATAIKINGKYYVLDQRLPVLTVNIWLVKWNRKDASVYVSELIRDSEGKPVGVDFKEHERISIPDFSEKPVNTEKLTKEVAKLLKISQTPQKEELDFKVTMPNFATYYEIDEIIIYSMARAIKNRLESELCSNIDKISKIEISQNGKDLIVEVYLLDNY